jgi:hypothetical protein
MFLHKTWVKVQWSNQTEDYVKPEEWTAHWVRIQ